ncbi:MAG: LPP20 family lipoprotein [Idiomarinaceae bacterium HL-53]|nr:MAG: LPP20 family lipoprotein [Idiomarinaceae bacterium HL-53]CUS48034.1 LPP20 lipoprotein [Idiomarinaceae bacterium HL-53]
MSYLKSLCLLSLCVVVSACSSLSNNPRGAYGEDSEFYREHASLCLFKDGETPAPAWVCGMPIEEYPYTATGYSDSGIEEEAKLNAMERLASRINTQITTSSRREVNANNRRGNSDYTSRTEVTVAEALQGTRVILRLVDPSTRGLHVLVVADEDAYEASLERAQQNARRD